MALCISADPEHTLLRTPDIDAMLFVALVSHPVPVVAKTENA